MELEEFKKICFDKKSRIEELKEKHKRLINEQSTLSFECYKPRYKIFRGIYCPVPECKNKLKDTVIEGTLRRIFSCSKCGYEYADYSSRI